MRMELGDHSTVRCAQTDLVADVEFKTKGFIGGTYDAIVGTIRRESTGEKLYEIMGKWNDTMSIKNLKTKKTSIFFDANTARDTLALTKPIAEMEARESRRLWYETTEAVKARDQVRATAAKSEIEDRQREEMKLREESGGQFVPRFFKKTGPEEYTFKADTKDPRALRAAMEEMAGGITHSIRRRGSVASSVGSGTSLSTPFRTELTTHVASMGGAKTTVLPTPTTNNMPATPGSLPIPYTQQQQRSPSFSGGSVSPLNRLPPSPRPGAVPVGAASVHDGPPPSAQTRAPSQTNQISLSSSSLSTPQNSARTTSQAVTPGLPLLKQLSANATAGFQAPRLQKVDSDDQPFVDAPEFYENMNRLSLEGRSR